MRKILMLAALVAVASAANADAQGRAGRAGEGRAGGRGGPGGPGMLMDRVLFKDITLTDAQKAKVAQLRKDEREKLRNESGGRGGASFEAIREAREKGDTATVNRLFAEQRAKMDERRDAQISTLRVVLNADQLTQFDANVAELKQREAEMGPGRGALGRGGRRGGPPPTESRD